VPLENEVVIGVAYLFLLHITERDIRRVLSSQQTGSIIFKLSKDTGKTVPKIVFFLFIFKSSTFFDGEKVWMNSYR
jgi:hypothetical protein